MVDKIITRQELVDAQKDAQTLEDVINGAPNVLIDTRLGRKVYTLASVPQINTMSRDEIEEDLAQKADLALLPLKADKADTFTKTEVTVLVDPKADKTYVDTALSGFTNGASKFYATLALANADIANIGIKDKVDIGEVANGGTWYKAAAGAVTLTKSPYDPLIQTKTYSEVQRKLGENNVTQMWFINPHYELVGQLLYFKPSLYSTTDNCFYLRDKRYPSDTITRTKLWGDLSTQVTPARFKVTSPLGVTDCIVLTGVDALLYDHVNKKIVLGARDTAGDYTVVVAVDNGNIGKCIEEAKILNQLLSRKTPETPPATTTKQVDPFYKIKGVAHRGFSSIAPENTLPAYALAKQKGFKYVECDISFTSDDVAMLLHDDTVNRTSTGTGALADMTAAVAKTFDYGSWKNSSYAGTQIPTLVEFLKLCRNLELHPYLEIKVNASTTKARVESVVDTVNSLGMQGKVTYISFGITELRTILAKDQSARLGLVGGAGESSSNLAATLKTTSNEVFVNADKVVATEVAVNYARSKGLGFEIWTVYDALTVRGFADMGVNGMTLEGFNLQDALLASYQ